MNNLEQQIQELGDKIVSDFIDTIEMLGAVVAAQERYYESSHSRFVAEKSAATAELLGMSGGEIFEIRSAGLLHDIGKIAVPEHILGKYTTEMTSEEYGIYASHPALGHEILSVHSSMKTIADIVLQHHERRDGSGFPKHLRGAQIHPGAMIINVVNVYHNAMFRRAQNRYQVRDSGNTLNSTSAYLHATQNRYSQVMNHLNRKAGVLYEAPVIEAFIELMEVERKALGNKVVKRVAVNQIRSGMQLAEDYSTSYGLLIVSRGEVLNDGMVESLLRFADLGEIPQKLLVVD